MFKVIGDFTPEVGDIVKATRCTNYRSRPYSIIGKIKEIKHNAAGEIERIHCYRVFKETHEIMKTNWGSPRSFAFYDFHENELRLIKKGDGQCDFGIC